MRLSQQGITKKKFILSVTIAAIVAFFIGVNIRNFFPIATVNGKPIKREIFAGRLIRTAATPILNELVIQELVFQEADKRKIKVTDKEIADFRKQIEKQLKDQSIDLKLAIAQQGKTESDFKRELKAQLLADKMFGGIVTVTNKDVDAYFTQNNIVKGKGAILESQLLSIRKLVYQQKLREVFGRWIVLQQKTAKVKFLLNF